MPEIVELTASDDEFQDALSDVGASSNTANPESKNPETLVTQDEPIDVAASSGAGGFETINAKTSAPHVESVDDVGTSNSAASSEAKHEYAASIEELIKKQSELNIPKQDDTDAEKSDQNKEQPAEYIDEVINEEALREAEKSLSPEELEANKEKAETLKIEGNELFKNDKAIEAIEIYTEALKICPMKYPKERAILYGNRAAAKIKLNSKKSAIDDCGRAIELWPDYVRALLRRAKLFEHEDKLDDALGDYKRVYELDPGQRDAREAMVRLPPIIQERNERLKEEMMSKLKDLGNMILKPFGLSTSNFKMEQDPNTGSYSINFSQGSK